MIPKIYQHVKLYSGNDPHDPMDQGRYTGTLAADLTIEGNFMTISLRVFDNDGKLIDFDESTDILPKNLAQLLIRMSGYDKSQT